MIILDSNQLRQAGPPDGALLGLLRKLAEVNGHDLAIPEMVQIENLAHVEHKARTAISALGGTARELSKIFQKDIAGNIPPLSVEDAIAARRTALDEIFTILPTPNGAERSALIMEARRQRPADVEWADDKSGSGARDVVIWLTVVEAARQHNDELLFLSEDKDFGNAAGWHPELLSEISDLRLRLLNDGINQLLGELAQETNEPDNILQIVANRVVVDAVTSAYAGQDVFFQMLAHATTGEPNSFIGSTAPRMVPLSKAGKTHTYTVGDQTWIATRIKWQATKEYDVHPVVGPISSNMRSYTISPSPAKARWQAEVKFDVSNTVLISLDDNGQPISAEVTNRGVLEFRDYSGFSNKT